MNIYLLHRKLRLSNTKVIGRAGQRFRRPGVPAEPTCATKQSSMCDDLLRRKLRLSNKKVQNELVNVSGGLEFLQAAGFQLVFDEADGYVLTDLHISNSLTAMLLLCIQCWSFCRLPASSWCRKMQVGEVLGSCRQCCSTMGYQVQRRVALSPIATACLCGSCTWYPLAAC